jgi:superfamily II DNA/RNA helicase
MARLGTALSLVTPDDVPMIRTIERLLGRTLERRKRVGVEAG